MTRRTATTTIRVHRITDRPGDRPVHVETVRGWCAEAGKVFDAWAREQGAERGEYEATYLVEPGEEKP